MSKLILIALLILSVKAVASYTADDAGKDVVQYHTHKKSVDEVVALIKSEAQSGGTFVKINQHCDDLSYLKNDGYGLVVAGGDEKNNTYYCVVTWLSKVKK